MVGPPELVPEGSLSGPAFLTLTVIQSSVTRGHMGAALRYLWNLTLNSLWPHSSALQGYQSSGLTNPADW